MALEAIVNRDGVFRVVLEEYPEGVYVLVFDTPEAKWPCRDNLQADWAMAKRSALRRWGISDKMWKEISDTRFNG